MATSDPESLFREWLARFQPLLWKVVRGFTRTPQDAQELWQDTLVQLWQSIPRYDGRCAPSTWIYRVACNTAMAWSRSHQRLRTRQGPEIEWENIAAPEDPGSALIEELYAAIRQLPKPDAALVMMHLDGLSYREMSEVMGLTESAIGAKLTRARARLGELMKGVLQ